MPSIARWQPLSALTPFGLDAVDERRRLLRLQALVPVVVVHHHDRCAIAGAEAFERLQGEHAGRIGFADLDAQLVRELFEDAFGAGQRARERLAHLQHVLADRVA